MTLLLPQLSSARLAGMPLALWYLAVGTAGDASLGDTVGHQGSKQRRRRRVLRLGARIADQLPPGGDRLRVPGVFNCTCRDGKEEVLETHTCACTHTQAQGRDREPTWQVAEDGQECVQFSY